MNSAVLILAVLVGATALLLTLGVIRTVQTPARRATFDEGLSVIAGSELDIDTALNKTESRSRGFFGYWQHQAERAGQKPVNPHGPGRLVLMLAVGGAVIGYLFAGPVGALLVPAVAIAGYRAFLSIGAGKRLTAMEKQLPILLSSLRANLQAGATPQQALLSVADDIPAPLGDEVRGLRDDLNVSVPLDEALRGLSGRVPSREMQFLASSIEIAVRSGADLDPQLATIEEIVAQRTRIRGKLKAAVAQVRPTQMIAALAVPLMLIVSLMSPENREFWFSTWGVTLLVIGSLLYFGGLFVMNRMVKSVENA